jgi:6-phosphogluconolactonase (cycloisomerase 2 family)
MLIYVGAYTPEGQGGIGCFRQDPVSGALGEVHPAVPVTDPSFLAWSPPGSGRSDVLYAVSESAGDVVAFARTEGSHLSPLSVEWTGGTEPCHLAPDPSGRFLVTANYGDGSVCVHPIEPDGSLGPRRELLSFSGRGPNPERQAGPHAHMIAHRPGGGSFFVTDLGTDTIHEYAVSPDGPVRAIGTTSLRPGSGPRSLAFHPTAALAYVTGELDSTVTVCEVLPEGLRPLAVVSATVESVGGANLPSHIVVSDDGRFVYAANRGADCITAYAVDGETLRPLKDTPTGGNWPRHFAIAGGFLYVANQNSATITGLRIDPQTGELGEAAMAARFPSPTCILAEPTA